MSNKNRVVIWLWTKTETDVHPSIVDFCSHYLWAFCEGKPLIQNVTQASKSPKEMSAAVTSLFYIPETTFRRPGTETFWDILESKIIADPFDTEICFVSDNSDLDVGELRNQLKNDLGVVVTFQKKPSFLIQDAAKKAEKIINQRSKAASK
jgi:hypothetical protein